MPSKTIRYQQLKSGFALVVILSLMVLISIIALGLISLSSVALRNSSHNDQNAQARANARMGLVFAISRLQELAGDDRRVTAAADLGMAAPSVPPSEHGSRYWTGVWGNPAADAVNEIYTETPQAEFKGWLVSGDRAILTDPDSTTVPLGDGVLLVGAGTAGDSTSEHVTVPLADVNPGAGKMAGRYGWWVGDEGVKTRANLPSTGNPATAATDLTIGMRGGGWETVTGMESYPDRGSAQEATLARVITVPTTSVAVPSVRTTAPQHFHSLTMDSRALLTDTLAGGLRTDLTSYLENGFPSSPASPDLPNAPVTGKNILPASIAPDILGPTWDRLRALRTLRPPAGGKLTVSAGNDGDQPRIAPVLIDLRMLLGLKLVLNTTDATAYGVHPCAKIGVALANPYPYPLRWTAPIELRLLRAGGSSTFVDLSNSTVNFGRRNFFLNGNSVFENTTFEIPPGELAAGEALAYTNSGPVNRPNNTTAITVPLGPFDSGDPSNFSNSLVQTQGNLNVNVPFSLGISELRNTARISVELRGGAAGSPILSRIEVLELDSSFPVSRNVSRSVAETTPEPIPVYLYSFQISQPGADYGSLLPNANQLGVRNSTLRTFTDFNIRAARFHRPSASYNAPPYFMEIADNAAALPSQSPGGNTGTAFTRNLAFSPLRWGHSPVSGPQKTILFGAPEKFVSLAQFQHADLTADDKYPSVAHQPGNALGNSYAPPFVKRGLAMETRYDYVLVSDNATATRTENRYYDLAYLLNAALWDSFFLSTVPASGSAAPLNPRIAEIQPGVLPAELRDPLLAASHLWIEGGFNVNSTRKDAWKALLASNRKLKHPAEATDPIEGAMFPRSLEQSGEPQLPLPSGDEDDSFNGFRRLDDAQLDALAEEITRQVRLRGPFVSLSHFVNRALADLTADENKLGRSGALQSAIDDSGLNMAPGSSSSGFANLTPTDNLVTMQRRGTANQQPLADMVGPRAGATFVTYTSAPADPVPAFPGQSKDLNPGNTGSMLSDREMLTNDTYRPEQGFRSTGIPGWLTQADVLQVIGPVLSARSDTFRIRSYGEALDSTGTPVARAWCEAIVQRTPEFIDPANPSETRPANLNLTNARFGRRFAVVSFRWLHPDEI